MQMRLRAASNGQDNPKAQQTPHEDEWQKVWTARQVAHGNKGQVEGLHPTELEPMSNRKLCAVAECFMQECAFACH